MNGIKRFTRRLSFFILLILVFSQGCKDDYTTSIPYVKVSLHINLTNSNGLTVPGNPVYFNGGYSGIIVIYTGFSYYAYDATCPNEISIGCKIVADGDVIGTCSCCESQFNLMDGGYVIKGPATEPLKQYRVTESGGTLIITN